MNQHFRHIIFSIAIILVLPAGTISAQQAQERVSVYFTSSEMLTSLLADDPAHKFAFSYHLLPAPGGTWGYDVFADGKLLYHQPGMPGKAGGAGFSTRTDAIKVAAAVVELLRHPTRPRSSVRSIWRR